MKVHVFTPVLGLYEGLPVSDFGPLVLRLLALPLLAFIASFSLSLSLSPLRGPGAGRPWPNPNSANSVSTQVGGGGCSLLGVGGVPRCRVVPVPRLEVSRGVGCSRIPPDASKEKPICKGRFGSSTLDPSGALQKLGCELGAGLRALSMKGLLPASSSLAGQAFSTQRRELEGGSVQTVQGRRPGGGAKLSLSCP